VFAGCTSVVTSNFGSCNRTPVALLPPKRNTSQILQIWNIVIRRSTVPGGIAWSSRGFYVGRWIKCLIIIVHNLIWELWISWWWLVWSSKWWLDLVIKSCSWHNSCKWSICSTGRFCFVSRCCIRYAASEMRFNTRQGPVHGWCSFKPPLGIAVECNQTSVLGSNGLPCTLRS